MGARGLELEDLSSNR
ncbi:hypothetical protein A2U01_0109014, partial [Trifolium medium]|nr:hypothetical protein [Trifolium medium]